MVERDPHFVERLLVESEWLQRLARRLVAEPAAAADAVQETLRLALDRAPRGAAPLRSWLGGVLRNVVRQTRRGESRRLARERSRGAGLQESEAADELAARLELQQRLLGHVRGLDEPYRSTVTLRFLEQLSVAEIAARQGVPQKTVHTRLERALARLREALDREHGSRSAWALVLAPAAPWTSLSPALLPSLLPMATLHWTAAAVGLVSVGLLGWWLHGDGPPAAPRSVSSPVAAAELEAPQPPEVATEPADGRRAAAPQPAPVQAQLPGSASASVPAEEVVRGRVLDLEQRPVAGVAVNWAHARSGAALESGREGPGAGMAVSDGAGRFELPAPGNAARLVATGRGLATVLAPLVTPAPRPDEFVVWVAAERSYAGRVVDADGQPLGGVDVEVRLDSELHRRLEPGVFSGSLPSQWTRTDERDGSFELGPLGYAEGSRLVVTKAQFRSLNRALPEFSEPNLLLVLEPLGAQDQPVAGVVLHLDGRPAAGAWVGLGAGGVVADAEGRFGLALPAETANGELLAVAIGHLPARLDLETVPTERWRDLELWLGGPALTIAGRVVDSTGAPVDGARVWTDDGQRFGTLPRSFEGLIFEIHEDVEKLIGGGSDDAGRRAISDAEGRFELRGLLDADYRLWAQDPRTLELGESRLVRGGSQVELELGGREPLVRVAGRVTDYADQPLPGVDVRVVRLVDLPGGGSARHESGAQGLATTGEQGQFEFEGLPIAGTRLVVAHFTPDTVEVELEGEPDLDQLTIRLPRLCRLRVHLADPDRATSLQLLDGQGTALNATLQLGTLVVMSGAVQLSGGVSDLIQTDERAVTLVLWKDGQEVERSSLRLSPSQVTEVHR
jgi:RNA polymerase sigma factor (sigma-70 family)